MIRLKRPAFSKRMSNESGIILIIVLWVLVILSVLTVSIGRNTNIEITLAKHAIGKIKTKYLAWAGLIYSINQIRLDSEDTESKKFDTLYWCGIVDDEGQSLESLFKEKKLKDGHFEIYYQKPVTGTIHTTVIGETVEDASEVESETVELGGEIYSGQRYYGYQDEERKININALTTKNERILSELIVVLGFDEETGKTIASSVIDWKDDDSNINTEGYGAEDEYYMSLAEPYHCKNALFESIEELMLVRGMTEDIYKAMKPFVTVIGKTDKLAVNFDTTDETVLLALARYGSGFSPTVEFSDAESFVRKMMEYRHGDDGIGFTPDDVPIDQNIIGLLLAPEKILYLVTNQFRTKVSNYIRVTSIGEHKTLNVQSRIDATVKREDLSIVYWKRQ